MKRMQDAIIAKREMEQKIQALVQNYTDTFDLHIETIEVHSRINSRNKRVITGVKAMLDSEMLIAAMS